MEEILSLSCTCLFLSAPEGRVFCGEPKVGEQRGSGRSLDQQQWRRGGVPSVIILPAKTCTEGVSGERKSWNQVSTLVGTTVSVQGTFLHAFQVLLLRNGQHRGQDLIVIPVAQTWPKTGKRAKQSRRGEQNEGSVSIKQGWLCLYQQSQRSRMETRLLPNPFCIATSPVLLTPLGHRPLSYTQRQFSSPATKSIPTSPFNALSRAAETFHVNHLQLSQIHFYRAHCPVVGFKIL